MDGIRLGERGLDRINEVTGGEAANFFRVGKKIIGREPESYTWKPHCVQGKRTVGCPQEGHGKSARHAVLLEDMLR